MPGTTPVYGFPYPEPTDLVADYPALGQQLAEDIEDVLPTLGGSRLVASQTFSAVSSVSVNNCFTATYDNYVAIIKTVNSIGDELNFRMRVGGADNTSANYSFQRLFANATAVSADRTTGATLGRIGFNATSITGFMLNIYSPALAEITMARSFGAAPLSEAYLQDIVIRHNVASAFDGISFLAASGTITGTARIYGFRNS